MEKFTIIFNVNSYRIASLINQFCKDRLILFKNRSSFLKSHNNQGVYSHEIRLHMSFVSMYELDAYIAEKTKDQLGNYVTLFEGLRSTNDADTIKEMDKVGKDLLNATLKIKAIEKVLAQS